MNLDLPVNFYLVIEYTSALYSLVSGMSLDQENSLQWERMKCVWKNKIIFLYPDIDMVGFMVFKATFNNVSVILWRSVLLVEETGGPRKNHRPVAKH